MHWHKWPYWLRGGTMGGIIALAFVGLILLCTLFDKPPAEGYACIIPFGIAILLPFLMIFIYFPSEILSLYFQNEIHLFLAVIAFWFLVGSLVGYIVTLVKRKGAHH